MEEGSTDTATYSQTSHFPYLYQIISVQISPK